MSIDRIDINGVLSGQAPAMPKGADAHEAAQAFEGYLTEMMVREMRKTVPEGLLGSQAIEVFSGVLDQEIARRIADRGSLGLARSLESHLSPVQPMTATPDDGALPVHGRITSRFGERSDPIDGTLRYHHGLDIAAPIGSPVTAAHAGRVVEAGERGGYGNVVVVDHGDGSSTLYAHCDRLDVTAGDRVRRGQVLATVGDTGRSTGPHLHYEVRHGSVPVDPLKRPREAE